MSYVVKKLSESLRQIFWLFAEQKTIATTNLGMPYLYHNH
jgi:hypothetical protein